MQICIPVPFDIVLSCQYVRVVELRVKEGAQVVLQGVLLCQLKFVIPDTSARNLAIFGVWLHNPS